jgi:hypothetical protein
MGIRHRGTLRSPKGVDGDGPPRLLKGCIRPRGLHRKLCSGLLTTLLLSPAMGSPSVISEYRCTPDIKHECTAVGCETMNNGFQRAESFAYRPIKRELAACLWTNCYAGSATVFADTATGTFTAIGRLTPAAHPGNEPIIVTLTIKTNTSNKAKALDEEAVGFTAVWGYGSEGLTLEMGKCVMVR